MNRRVIVVAIVAAVVAAGGAIALQGSGSSQNVGPSQSAMAGAIGGPVMTLLYRGHVPDRSAEIMLVPEPHHYLIGEWDLTTLGSETPETATSHPNPWGYLTRVPIVLFGPGYAPRGKDVYDEVDISGLPATFADVLGLELGHGEPLPDGLIDSPAKPPRVIFTVVIDGGGWNALQQHPDAHPVIDSLRAKGVTYLNATIGSAPSITGALHSTFGTGAYPIDHGIPGNQMRGPDGENTDTWRQNADPSFLKLPTVAELWDESRGNRPTVATVSYEGWHLGMIGHGAQREGGDKDIAVLWEAENNEWWINEDFYELPDYFDTTDLARLERYEAGLDKRDGLADGTWFGHNLDELQMDVVRPGSPAFTRFTGDAVIDVLRREGIGTDRLTDMVWIEMKMPDYAGHLWNVLSREEEDVIREVDRQIGRFVRLLDKQVGQGNYLLAISADHGQQPFPDLFGGWRINNKELERDIEDRFGPVVEKITPVDIYVDRGRVEREDVDLDEVARFIGAYTLADNIPPGAPGADLVPEGRLDDRLFAGAFTTEFLRGLDQAELSSLGPGEYPEGDLTIDPPAGR